MGSTEADMKTFSPRQLLVANAVAATLFEADASHPVPRERLEFAMEELRAYASKVGLQTRLAFNAAFFVMQMAPVFLFGRLRRFTSLSGRARKRCLERLERSRLGLVVVLLKTVLSMVYFEHPDALAALGYDAEGLLGPAWAQDGSSPIKKKLRVLQTLVGTNPAPGDGAPAEDDPQPKPQSAAGGS